MARTYTDTIDSNTVAETLFDAATDGGRAAEYTVTNGSDGAAVDLLVHVAPLHLRVVAGTETQDWYPLAAGATKPFFAINGSSGGITKVQAKLASGTTAQTVKGGVSGGLGQ